MLKLLDGIKALFSNRVETASAPGGQCIVYPMHQSRVVSVRSLYSLAQQHGKCLTIKVGARFTITFYDDVDETPPTAPLALCASAALSIFKTSCKPAISESEHLPQKVAGSTFADVLRFKTTTVLPFQLIARWFSTPLAFDIHVSASHLCLLQARPSNVTNSLAQLLQRGKLNVQQRPRKRLRQRRKLRVVRR